MAINTKDFPNTIVVGLKANKEHTKFYYRFKIEGKTKRGIIDYSNKSWDKRTRKSEAIAEMQRIKNKGLDTDLEFNENTSLNKVAKIYFKNARADSTWTDTLKRSYELYCENSIGNKKIKDIKTIHIDALIRTMQNEGQSKQTSKGCSHRTIKLVLIQSLKPILEYSVEHKVLDTLPSFKLPKQKKQKKKVTDARIKLATLFKTINSLYEHNHFYKALFLFALFGRRWNEIRTLEWKDIDFLNNQYTIRAENNKIAENQTYDLAPPIAEALQGIKDTHTGIVFKSPVTGEELHTPKVQLARLRKASEIEELTMHYFRHILVSAMGEMGTANTILSASLGHTNLDTVNQFYLSANHTKASSEANKAIAGITNG
ncbi:MAG: tyrosine-type recombinase/integrase [Campylobacterota bacterium]